MIKAVVDTNVFVSGLLNASGAPAKLILYWIQGQFDIVFYKQILAEYSYVLHHIPGIHKDKVTTLLNEVKDYWHFG